jgi:hypothetical protein
MGEYILSIDTTGYHEVASLFSYYLLSSSLSIITLPWSALAPVLKIGVHLYPVNRSADPLA